MYRIAIVDDEKIFTDQLEEYMVQYQAENQAQFQVTVFHSSTGFLENFRKEYDLILLDVEMPELNGMELAEKIRETDEQVVLMFITNMAQYAIHGYSVGALDFVTKPLNYYTFAMKLTRALKRVPKKEAAWIMLPFPDGVKRLEVRKIYYLEVQNRFCIIIRRKGNLYCEVLCRRQRKSLPDSLLKNVITGIWLIWPM